MESGSEARRGRSCAACALSELLRKAVLDTTSEQSQSTATWKQHNSNSMAFRRGRANGDPEASPPNAKAEWLRGAEKSPVGANAHGNGTHLVAIGRCSAALPWQRSRPKLAGARHCLHAAFACTTGWFAAVECASPGARTTVPCGLHSPGTCRGEERTGRKRQACLPSMHFGPPGSEWGSVVLLAKLVRSSGSNRYQRAGKRLPSRL